MVSKWQRVGRRIDRHKINNMTNKIDIDRLNSFLDWKHSDNVIKTNNGIYITQCSQFKLRMTQQELYNYYTKEYASNK